MLVSLCSSVAFFITRWVLQTNKRVSDKDPSSSAAGKQWILANLITFRVNHPKCDQICQYPLFASYSKLFTRYMDDILREIDYRNASSKLDRINTIHPSLQFTIERENNMPIPFLDMLIKRDKTELSIEWYTKPTDTGH